MFVPFSSRRCCCGQYWTDISRYLCNFQNHPSDTEWVVDPQQRDTNCCQENKNQVCNPSFIARFSACTWADCQRDIFAGEKWRKLWFNLHRYRYTTPTDPLISFQDHPVPELVAATGSGINGGFTPFQVHFPFSFVIQLRLDSWTLYQRDLPVLAKRKLHIIGGARGLWSSHIRQPKGRVGYHIKIWWTHSMRRWTSWLWARISICRPGFREQYVFLAWSFDYYFFSMDKSYAAALVYFFSALPFHYYWFCLTYTFFAGCNEVEQEWRGDHRSRTWDSHWSCSIPPMHCDSTHHDQCDQGRWTWYVSLYSRSFQATTSKLRSVALACAMATLSLALRQPTAKARRSSLALPRFPNPPLSTSLLAKVPRSLVWLWICTTALLLPALFGKVPTPSCSWSTDFRSQVHFQSPQRPPFRYPIRSDHSRRRWEGSVRGYPHEGLCPEGLCLRWSIPGRIFCSWFYCWRSPHLCSRQRRFLPWYYHVWRVQVALVGYGPCLYVNL